MNRRYSIIILCILLPLLFLGCQSYTASKGRAEIAPIPSVIEEKTITKYSVIQEMQAQQEEQKRAALALEQQAERDARLVLLTAREQELQDSLETLKSRLATVTEENQQLLDTLTAITVEKEEIALGKELSAQESAERMLDLQSQNALLSNEILELQGSLEKLKSNLATVTEEKQQLLETLTAITVEKEEIALGKELSAQESAERLLALQSQNALLNNEIFELQSLIEENKALQEEQKEQRLRIEREQEQERAEQERKALAAWQELTNEYEALQVETRMLKAQLEEKTLTIQEKVRLEMERSEEAKRVEQQRLARAQAQEAEAKRIEAEEEAKRLAREKEWRQIPPLDQITYPRRYKTEKPTTLANDGEKLHALMLPLDDIPWKDRKIVMEVHTSIRDLEIPVIFVTGHMENVIALVKEMRSNAVLFSTGAIITSFPIKEISNFGTVIQYQKDTTLRLMLANLPEYQVVRQFVEGKDWQATQKSITADRLTLLKEILGEGELTAATLMGASLYEPSYRDWNTFSPVGYRQIDYLWPLSDFLESEGFYDTYRLTHFSEATNAGNTLIAPEWGERVDYLYSRKILPLSSTLLTIGGESAPDESGISRFGVLGTFLVP